MHVHAAPGGDRPRPGSYNGPETNELRASESAQSSAQPPHQLSTLARQNISEGHVSGPTVTQPKSVTQMGSANSSMESSVPPKNPDELGDGEAFTPDCLLSCVVCHENRPRSEVTQGFVGWTCLECSRLLAECGELDLDCT